MKIVLFDAECLLCHRSLRVLMYLDKKRILKYTSLQGEFRKTLQIDTHVDSIVFYDEEKIYYKSTAILKILRSFGGLWSIVSIFYLIPQIVRDFVYDVIAKHRYAIFGKMEHCLMPREDEKELFLP